MKTEIIILNILIWQARKIAGILACLYRGLFRIIRMNRRVTIALSRRLHIVQERKLMTLKQAELCRLNRAMKQYREKIQ